VETWSLEFFETESGRQPVQEFLERLPATDQARALRELDRLAEFGTALSFPEVRQVSGSNLWELRVRGKNDFRIFYVVAANRTIVLLHAFAKKSQRTPLREIATANTRLREYQRRFP